MASELKPVKLKIQLFEISVHIYLANHKNVVIYFYTLNKFRFLIQIIMDENHNGLIQSWYINLLFLYIDCKKNGEYKLYNYYGQLYESCSYIDGIKVE